MKKYLMVIGIIALLGACVSTKDMVKHDQSAETKDSTKYELVTFDFGFDSWFAMYEHNGDVKSLDYYKSWNSRYVTEWNHRATSYYTSRFFNSTLNFDPYDIEDLKTQRKLFYYFQYVENKLRIPIIQGGGPRLFY